MGKATAFLEYPRVNPVKRAPGERIRDWNEIRQGQGARISAKQAARCMNCGVPFCHGGVLLNGMVSGCPAHNLIPEWNELVFQGQWKEAYQRLIRTNPFPEFTGRVCPAPCEGACTAGHIMEPVTINSLEYEIIERAFAEGWVKTSSVSPTGKRVAVVGSGPAGLSAAYYLNTVGHEVTVYERSDRAGGLLMYGIPSMKLDKGVVQRRINLMAASGIRFVLNTEIGSDIMAQELVDHYDAVVLCGGATRPRRLEVEGNRLKGVHYAVDFLAATTRSLLDSNLEDGNYINARGKNVLVIGGGDTGTDCVAVSIRHGCKSVSQLEIMPPPPPQRDIRANPWPEWPHRLRIDYGQEEAICLYGQDPRNYLVSATRLEGNESDEVQAVHTVEVTWVEDEQKRLVPREVSGSEKIWPADLVILAMGFVGPEDVIPDELGLQRDHRGNVKARYGVFATNVEKVFAAGDMRRGPSLVIWAIQEGKLAAREVDKYLRGQSLIK